LSPGFKALTFACVPSRLANPFQSKGLPSVEMKREMEFSQLTLWWIASASIA